MSSSASRRELLKAAIGLAGLQSLRAQPEVVRLPGSGIRIALNSYSFNKPLMDRSITLSDVIRFCARHAIDGLDATGYYFPNYPQTPGDNYVLQLKREAYINGVTIFATGVRNDFSVADAAERKQSVQLVKNWIEVAARLGASQIRIFSGRSVPRGYSFDQVLEWMIPDINECVSYGRRHGVIVGLQNHNDFLKTADETIRIVKAVNSEWFGIVLDIGSLRQHDPYSEIEKLLPYAVSWQLKEKVGYHDREVPTDLQKIKSIIDKIGYRGFLPIETLGPGDPEQKVTKFLADVRAVFAG